MKNSADIENRINQLIADERVTDHNPFLSTRIMAAIEKQTGNTGKTLVWKPLLALASLVLVVWLGIAAGNGYTSVTTTRTAIGNDHATEHFAFYHQTEKEE